MYRWARNHFFWLAQQIRHAKSSESQKLFGQMKVFIEPHDLVLFWAVGNKIQAKWARFSFTAMNFKSTAQHYIGYGLLMETDRIRQMFSIPINSTFLTYSWWVWQLCYQWIMRRIGVVDFILLFDFKKVTHFCYLYSIRCKTAPRCLFMTIPFRIKQHFGHIQIFVCFDDEYLLIN